MEGGSSLTRGWVSACCSSCSSAGCAPACVRFCGPPFPQLCSTTAGVAPQYPQGWSQFGLHCHLLGAVLRCVHVHSLCGTRDDKHTLCVYNLWWIQGLLSSFTGSPPWCRVTLHARALSLALCGEIINTNFVFIGTAQPCHHKTIDTAQPCHHKTIDTAQPCHHKTMDTAQPCHHKTIDTAQPCHHKTIDTAQPCHLLKPN